MADCRKGDKYGKGLLIKSGEAFDEQGDRKEQEAIYDGNREVDEEFVHVDDDSLLMVRRVYFTPQKVGGDDK